MTRKISAVSKSTTGNLRAPRSGMNRVGRSIRSSCLLALSYIRLCKFGIKSIFTIWRDLKNYMAGESTTKCLMGMVKAQSKDCFA
jgi:hypothetical protein